MSSSVNTLLFERAAEMIDYWPGTLHADLIEQDLTMNDLSSLEYHVSNAEAEASRQEFSNANIC